MAGGGRAAGEPAMTSGPHAKLVSAVVSLVGLLALAALLVVALAIARVFND